MRPYVGIHQVGCLLRELTVTWLRFGTNLSDVVLYMQSQGSVSGL